LKKLDKVSGNLADLDRVFKEEHGVSWTREEDDLLNKNAELLVRWKGQEAVNLRKRYNTFKAK